MRKKVKLKAVNFNVFEINRLKKNQLHNVYGGTTIQGARGSNNRLDDGTFPN